MKTRWKYACLGLAGLLIALSCAPAQAASGLKTPGRAELVKALSDCRAITDPTERLACYDKAAAALDQAQAKGDVIVVDRQQVREVKRQAFGFNLDALSIFDRGGAKDAAEESITGVARSAAQTSTGKWIVTLEGGEIWRQIDTEELSRDPHPGSNIRIRRAVLGSFMMNIDGQPGIRVHRDQ
jgi:hypothetical protein